MNSPDIDDSSFPIENHFTVGDVLFRFNRKGLIDFGILLESESSSDWDDENLAIDLKKIAWYPCGKENIANQQTVYTTEGFGLANRALMQGMAVRRLVLGPNEEVQVGYCRDINMKSDLKIIGTNYIVENVDADRLRPFKNPKYNKDYPVCLDNKMVGTTLHIEESVNLKSSTGTITEVSPEDFELFNPMSGMFYPGHILTGPLELIDNTEESNILNANEKFKFAFTKFEVQTFHLNGLVVNWLSELVNNEIMPTNYNQYITGEELNRLKLIKFFEPTMVEIKDRNYLKLFESDIITERSQWEKQQVIKYKLIWNKQKGEKKLKHKNITNLNSEPHEKKYKLSDDSDKKCKINNSTYSETQFSVCSNPSKSCPRLFSLLERNKSLDENVFVYNNVKKPEDEIITEVLVNYSTVTIVWQNGTIESNIPSTEICPIHLCHKKEFFPGDFVLSDFENKSKPAEEYGVVQTVDRYGKIAYVKWFIIPSAKDISPIFIGESEVSLYNLRRHPLYKYKPGVVVFVKCPNFNIDCEDIGTYSYTVGEVMYSDISGKVKVWSVDDKVIMCFPYNLTKVGYYDNEKVFRGLYENWKLPPDIDDNESNEIVSTTNDLVFGVTSTEDIINKSVISTNFKTTSNVLSKLEQICSIPNMETPIQEVILNLLIIYSNCLVLDTILKTSYFNQTNLTQSLESILRFSHDVRVNYDFLAALKKLHPVDLEDINIELNPRIMTNTNISQLSTDRRNVMLESEICNEKNKLLPLFLLYMNKVFEKLCLQQLNTSKNYCEFLCNSLTNDFDIMLNINMVKEIDQHTEPISINNITDNGNYEYTINLNFSKAIDNQKTSIGNIPVRQDTPQLLCANFCSIIKRQLNIVFEEIQERYLKNILSLNYILNISKSNEIISSSKDFDYIENNEIDNNIIKIKTVDENIAIKEKDVGNENEISVTENDLDEPLEADCFQIVENVPDSHRFRLTTFQQSNSKEYNKALNKELKLLQNSLPSGVWVRVFEDRMDLISVMIQGPKKTPYEFGLFFFDIQLVAGYPKEPPKCQYISYCNDQLNPNLYEDGKICISLLGTWPGRYDSEVWGPNSTLLQLIVSIQGLILVAEPFFNEPDYETQVETESGRKNSRMYNEVVIIKLVESMTTLLNSPPKIFHNEIIKHFEEWHQIMYDRIKSWIDYSKTFSSTTLTEKNILFDKSAVKLVDFPLLPATRGWCITLSKLLETLCEKIQSFLLNNKLNSNIIPSSSLNP